MLHENARRVFGGRGGGGRVLLILLTLSVSKRMIKNGKLSRCADNEDEMVKRTK